MPSEEKDLDTRLKELEDKEKKFKERESKFAMAIKGFDKKNAEFIKMQKELKNKSEFFNSLEKAGVNNYKDLRKVLNQVDKPETPTKEEDMGLEKKDVQEIVNEALKENLQSVNQSVAASERKAMVEEAKTALANAVKGDSGKNAKLFANYLKNDSEGRLANQFVNFMAENPNSNVKEYVETMNKDFEDMSTKLGYTAGEEAANDVVEEVKAERSSSDDVTIDKGSTSNNVSRPAGKDKYEGMSEDEIFNDEVKESVALSEKGITK